MRCIQATRIISDSHERSLELQEKMGLKMHLLTSPHCRRFQRNCKTLSEMMKRFKNRKNQPLSAND